MRFQLEKSDLTECVSGREGRALRESMLEGNGMVVGALPIRDVGASNLFATQRPHTDGHIDLLLPRALYPREVLWCSSSASLDGHSHFDQSPVDLKQFPLNSRGFGLGS